MLDTIMLVLLIAPLVIGMWAVVVTGLYMLWKEYHS